MTTRDKTRTVTAEAWLSVLTLHQKTKTKLESLLHFYAIKEKSYEFLFSDKRKLHFKSRQTLSRKKINLFNQKCIFLSKKMWSRKFSANALQFPVHSHGIKLLISNRRKRPKIPKSYISTSYHVSVNFSSSFLLLHLACVFLLRQSSIRNSQKVIINLHSSAKYFEWSVIPHRDLSFYQHFRIFQKATPH